MNRCRMPSRRVHSLNLELVSQCLASRIGDLSRVRADTSTTPTRPVCFTPPFCGRLTLTPKSAASTPPPPDPRRGLSRSTPVRIGRALASPGCRCARRSSKPMVLRLPPRPRPGIGGRSSPVCRRMCRHDRGGNRPAGARRAGGHRRSIRDARLCRGGAAGAGPRRAQDLVRQQLRQSRVSSGGSEMPRKPHRLLQARRTS